jgi:hypothetical protein
MYAKNLERLLAELSRASDMSRPGADMQERFESLRRYGKLPIGREKRAQVLTSGEIANTLLGLVPAAPKWAGHAVAVLQNMQPAGRPDNAFGGAKSLQSALRLLLDDPTIRRQFVRLSLSGAEGGINSNGFASIIYDHERERRCTFYVPSTAVSLLQRDAEKSIDGEARYAPLSRELSINAPFIERLAREIQLARSITQPPEGDGSEYDEEEAQQALYKSLGVTPRSRFLNIGVENQVTWPKKPTRIEFDGVPFVMLPKTAEHSTSLHIDLTEARLDERRGRTAMNRLLSVMSWCDDNFAVLGDGWSGNPVPVAVRKRDFIFTTANQWFFVRKLPASADARRALALYREARNAEVNGIVSYAVLNFYKIVEMRHHGKSAVRNWFRDNFHVVENDAGAKNDLKRFREICGSEQAHIYIYNSCRLAVAHAGKDSKSDPDDAEEILRLHIAAHILRRLARHLILEEFKISDSPLSGD